MYQHLQRATSRVKCIHTRNTITGESEGSLSEPGTAVIPHPGPSPLSQKNQSRFIRFIRRCSLLVTANPLSQAVASPTLNNTKPPRLVTILPRYMTYWPFDWHLLHMLCDNLPHQSHIGDKSCLVHTHTLNTHSILSISTGMFSVVSPWHINTFCCIYTFINTMYTLSVCRVCRSTHDRLCPEMMRHPVLGSPPEMMCPPVIYLAYQDCYLYGYSHAADIKIDTQSICTWQINTKATVHHDNTDRWTTRTRQTNTQTAVHRDNPDRCTTCHYVTPLCY